VERRIAYVGNWKLETGNYFSRLRCDLIRVFNFISASLQSPEGDCSGNIALRAFSPQSMAETAAWRNSDIGISWLYIARGV